MLTAKKFVDKASLKEYPSYYARNFEEFQESSRIAVDYFDVTSDFNRHPFVLLTPDLVEIKKRRAGWWIFKINVQDLVLDKDCADWLASLGYRYSLHTRGGKMPSFKCNLIV